MSWEVIHGDCIEKMNAMPEQSVDLVFGSPPYCDARTYDDGTLPEGHVVSRDSFAWVEWMLEVTDAALRVCKGPVLWVAAGVTRGRNYWPACEGLMWEWHKSGGSAYRPCYWHRIGIPGSGGDQWFRSDVEYVMCFKRAGKLPWSDNTAMGHAPKYAIGGDLSYRNSDGTRINKRAGHFRVNDGSHDRNICEIANPGNVIKTKVGGGHLGDRIAHENEAPFPEKLAEFFIRSLCPPGGTVLDPFSGSGTTAKVAVVTGRKAIGIDIRKSQAELSERRLQGDSAKIRELF